MIEYLLALIISQFPLSGNDLYPIAIRSHYYGATITNFSAAQYSRTVPAPSLSQLGNLANIAAVEDWDIRPVVKTLSLTNWHKVLAPFISVAPTPNNTELFIRFAQEWQFFWQATPLDDQVLRRLTVLRPEIADELYTRMSANPANAPHSNSNLVWYAWWQLKSNRARAAMAKIEAQWVFDKSISGASEWPASGIEPVMIWPLHARVDRYIFAQRSKKWHHQVTEKPSHLLVKMEKWDPPQGNQYKRTWQKGPSWQVVYRFDGTKLIRAVIYTGLDSFILGTIKNKGFSEEVVTLDIPPKRVIQSSDFYIEVQY